MQKENIPFLFMTNGGGYTEETKAKQYEQKFGVKLFTLLFFFFSHSSITQKKNKKLFSVVTITLAKCFLIFYFSGINIR